MEQTLSQLLQQMQVSHTAQQEQLARLAQLQAEQTQRQDQQMQQLAQMQAEQANALRDIADRRQGVVDVRQVGKPENLTGTREAIVNMWPSWQFTFVTWFCSQFANG